MSYSNTTPMEEPRQFDSQFNMAVSKLQRMHNLLMKAHESAINDEHITWKTCLDGIHRELWAYIDEKDLPKEVTAVKELSQKKMMEYLSWTHSNNQLSLYARQQKQLVLEGTLDHYERVLIRIMKNHDMDLPEKENWDNFELA